MSAEAVCFSETSADFQRTTRRYIPQYRTFNNEIIHAIALRLWDLEGIMLDGTKYVSCRSPRLSKRCLFTCEIFWLMEIFR
jgi:hypothetical protein